MKAELCFFLFEILNILCHAKLQHPQLKQEYKKNAQNKKENVFTDVIQNITRVNDVIEDLINNYEKLKNIYKSKEIVADYSSDIEIDEVYKQKKEREKRIGSKRLETTKDPSKIATEMFFSEEKPKFNENDSSENNIKSNENDSTKETPNKVTNGKEKGMLKKKYPNEEKSNKTFNNDLGKPTRFRETNNPVIVKQIPKIEFLTKNNDEKKTGKVRSKIQSQSKNVNIKAPSEEVSTESKTETSNESDSDETDTKSAETIAWKGTDNVTLPKGNAFLASNALKKGVNKYPANNATRTVKQVFRTEEFSKNHIWDEVISKPVKLDTRNEVYYKQPKIYFRNQVGETVGPNIKPKQKKKLKATPTYPKTKKHTLDSLEDEKNIMKEQFKTRILRKAYGDACLKVVVRKCYKSCKAALKTTCHKFSCKSNFKTTFENSAKTGCVQEFDEPHDNKTDNKTQRAQPSITADKDMEFKDITRHGYLTAACLPSSKTKEQLRATLNLGKAEKQLNILRDRFEKECQKISSDKCTDACHYAVKTTCDKEECSSGKRKDFKKECKKECKHAYSYKHSKSDSDSSTDSGSGSSSSSSSSGSSSGSSSHHSTSKEKPGHKKKVKKNEAPKKQVKVNHGKKDVTETPATIPNTVDSNVEEEIETETPAHKKTTATPAQKEETTTTTGGKEETTEGEGQTSHGSVRKIKRAKPKY